MENNVELCDYTKYDGIPSTDSLFHQSREKDGPYAPSQASKMLVNPGRGPLSETDAMNQMKQFFDNYYADTDNVNPEKPKEERLAEVMAAIEADGDYRQTYDELSWSAKTAWRNAPRCVGRNIWKTLKVVDVRDCLTCEEIFEAICINLRLAYNGGLIQPHAVVFGQRHRKNKRDGPGVRVWNGVLLAFAGFVKENGDIIGDPKYVPLTNLAMSFGWAPTPGNFVLLPVVITDYYGRTEYFELPADIQAYTVDIAHPTEPEITDLGLKWYAIPTVSSMMLEAGGIQYTCTQVAGFFQDTEISVMNLLAESRYNLMEPIGRKLKLDVSKNSTYWKCTVATELTKAVYHSFQQARVTIDDHISLSDKFNSFMKEEIRTRGGCPSDWLWVVPPMSSGLTPNFHHEMLRYTLSPSYEYQAGPEHYFKKPPTKVKFYALTRTIMYFMDMMRKYMKLRKRITFVYATEGNTSYTYAKLAESLFVKAFYVSVMPITAITERDDFEKCKENTDLCVFIASTFGEGGPPSMAEEFHKNLNNKLYDFAGMRYTVFALGSTQYAETFAKFGMLIDSEVEAGGGIRYEEIGFGNDQSNQKVAFETWIEALYDKCCDEFLPGGGRTEEDTKERLYRWRYYTEKSLNQSFQEGQGDAHKVFEFSLKDKKILTTDGTDKYMLLTLSYKTEEEMNGTKLFLPGQHIAIFPKNIASNKEHVLKDLIDIPFNRVPLSLEEKIAVHEPWRVWDNNLSGLSLSEWIENVADLNRLPENLGKGFDSAKFFGLTPTIKRRLYSIASCQNEDNTVDILLATHEFQIDGKTVTGLASSFVRHASQGDKIQGYFSQTDEQMVLPPDHSIPVILISSGSGFAPFMSFIKAREQAARSGQKTGPIYIFHGVRHVEWDFLGLLLKEPSHVLEITTFRAYSRSDPSKLTVESNGLKTGAVIKGYVQNVLASQEEVVAKVCREGGYMYACGGGKVVAAVRSQLDKILQNQGCTPLQELIDSARYQEEKFG